ncbi:MAG TPA: hypothetical protein VD794_06070 [Flavisolibacter sp.]|nr:hypothetical protein [Flavisolibacter sp.]
MLLHQFNRLTESRQYRHLILHGVCVADRSTNTEDLLLFQLSDCYVEVIFTRDADHILGLHCFRDTHALHPYLEAIDIAHLFN